jgi:hypothetical protein
MTNEEIAETLLSHIKEIVTTYWEDPDWEGLEIVLGFLGAYRLNEKIPFWLHVVGGPSSGKTEVGLAPIENSAPDHWQLDTLTAQTFLSGYTGGGGKENSYLHRIGQAGLISMGDFTTIMDQPEPLVKAIAGQLRRMFDGSFSKETGVSNDDSKWAGRLSIITAMTPEAFRLWTSFNVMGERFLALQWRPAPKSDKFEERILAQAARYADDTKEISPRDIIANLTAWLMDGMESGKEWPSEFPQRVEFSRIIPIREAPKPKIPSREMLAQKGNSLFKMADVVALLRTMPKKRYGGVIGIVDNKEASGRIQHQFLKLIRGYSYLMRREVQTSDLRLVRRLALDSIPTNRTSILAAMLSAPREFHQLAFLQEQVGYVQLEPLERDILEMYALGVLTPRQEVMTGADSEFKLSDSFLKLFIDAFGIREKD